MRIRLAGLVLGAFGTLSWACIATPPAYDVLSFCNDKAQAMCQVASMCSIDPGVCQMYQFGLCKSDAVQATSPYRRVYNEDNARFCITAVQAAYHAGATSISSTQLASIHDTCERVYLGTSGVGQFCEMDYDCASGLFCAPKTPGGTPAVCEPATQVNEGQSCGDPGAQCAADTYCAKQTNGTWTCSSCPGAGQQCASGTYCMSTEHCVKGTCEPRGEQGAPCVSNDDCAADSPYCDSYSNMCAPGLAFQRGNVDCQGVSGIGAPPEAADAGGGEDGGSGP
jgi:hypothetical protein